MSAEYRVPSRDGEPLVTRHSSLGASSYTPDYLVIGHVAKDLTPNGEQAGGSALYAGLTAQRLGLQSAVVTARSEADDWLLDELREAGVWVMPKLSPHTTTFTNRYDAEGGRKQVISAQAAPLSLADVPHAWRAAPIVHLGPIAHELPPDMPLHFTQDILGITPQGWLRAWDAQGNVSHAASPVPPALSHLPPTAILVMSQEDLGFDAVLFNTYAHLTDRLIITNSSDPASIFIKGDKAAEAPAYTSVALDPTGAGDVFAAALFIRYHETHDLLASAKFAHAAASLSISSNGTSGIPSRQIVERLIASSQ